MISEDPPDSSEYGETDLPLVSGPVELTERTSNGHLVAGQEEFCPPVQTKQVVQPHPDNVVLGTETLIKVW